jgi:hypothetical protein
MDLVIAGLRLIHIVAAFIWFGLGMTMVFYIGPAVGAAGESGLRFLKSLIINTPFARAIPIAAGLTTLAGILMYLIGNSASHFTTTGNIVLGIGAVAGLLAAGHGGAVTGRATRDLGEALAKYVADNQPIASEGVATLREAAMKVGQHSRISFMLMVIALLGMASARYL